ncbi:MAG: hypothetical protein AAGB19_04955 [Cyanobacteria bacterium P01_F01_bin.3]
MCEWVQVPGLVKRGHGVASGQSGDPRFPKGTLEMQKPIFRRLGLNLDDYFMGTINFSISPKRYEIRQSRCTFRQVKWSPAEPAEDFSFFDCRIVTHKNERIDGLVYYPHPETKSEHFQPTDILEIVMPYISSLKYEDELLLEVDSQQLHIF